MRKTAQLILINLAIFCCLLLVMELSVRLVVDSYSDHKTFRLTRPAPYLGAPYFSEEFINESFVQPGGWSTPPGTSLLFPNDFKGRFFTVENGIRRTTDTPGQASKNLFLFGGSTVYNSEVPDSYTIASYLQRKLASTGINDYRVLNYGVTSVSTNQQLERLKTTKLAPGDIVVFLDGVNDVVQGVLYGNAGDTIHGSDKARPAWQKTLSRLAKHSVLVRQLLSRMNANYKITNLNGRVTETVSRYRRNIEAAVQITRQQGAQFQHFLQPNLFSLATRRDYEDRLLKLGLIAAQTEEAFLATYPHFSEIVRQRSRQNHAEHDLTSIFDGLQRPVYLDFCHINHIGNETIADHIYSGLAAAKVFQHLNNN